MAYPLLSVKVGHNIYRLKNDWEEICSKNPMILPLHYFTYYKFLFLSFYAKHLISRWRIVFYVLSDGMNDCIIPFVINNKRHLIRSISYYGRLDYEDIISSTNDLSFVKYCWETVLNMYNGYDIHFKNINENSLLFKAFGNKMFFLENCVSLDLPFCFDEYIAHLSKHQRQNVRTAYNKLKKENFSISLRQFDEKELIPRKLWRNCQQMYEQRHYTAGNTFSLWLERQINPYTHILVTAKGWRVYVLFHDNIPISYMAGLANQEHSCLYVPRLCIDNKYVKYSPGVILIIETIKQLINHNISHLDLMLGDEPYKTAMGGRIHKNYELKCKVDDMFY